LLLPADVAWAVACGKRVEMQFVDTIDVMYDASIPWHLRFFRLLDHIVLTEPWQPANKAVIDQIKSIGIKKGKPLTLDPTRQGALQPRQRLFMACQHSSPTRTRLIVPTVP
jgi:hypothetical protein